ncbi:hypothetical protein CVT25_014314 [Psilocybe cyanescens]|uniref:Major facilitator superfamily (MFS) profile domain-containing protein n=1 Tax=Psilocybe cyanescens TaxID=93625 RepID=A0A409XL45_PSICY|nr:hypothetical protein CVT25_014314 [Psilocybe cyanescens]
MPTQGDAGEHSRRSQQSRTVISTSLPYVPQPESLILPDGAVGEETAELLEEFVHPHHSPEETLIGSENPAEDESDDEPGKKLRKPWWKRPSPWWLLGVLPFTAIAMSATIAPRIEIYTILACSVHKPDIFRQAYPERFPDLEDFSESRYQYDTHVPDPHPTVPLITPIYLSVSPPTGSSDVINWSNKSAGTPTNRNLCAADPTVQAAVAKLTAVIATSMGILSLLTTGWWGAFSDRHGRARVMGISILALLITDFNFILVVKFSKYLPGGYWFLVVGPALEGLFGGMATGVAAMHGYMADTTTENTRSRMFSLSLGLLFSGMAIGPTLGSLLIRFTGETISVFYLATAVHLAYTILVWTILPESLAKEQMENAKMTYSAELLIVANEREQNSTVSLLVKTNRLFTFLSPLTVFLPTQGKPTGNPLKKPKNDYNLALMAVAYGFTVSIMGSYTYKFQYAASTFGWSTETIGYWVSLSGATRAIFMAIILPLLIKLFKPEPVVLVLPVTPSEATPLLASDRDQSRSPSATRRPKTITKEIHSPAFDLGLARGSLIIEIIAYSTMGLATAPITFLVLSIFGSMGAGFSPAAQSVMLSLYSRRGGTEFGRLFGALSVVQALCSQIIGPALYGFVFINTVNFFPSAIFYVTTFSVSASFILLAFVRLPKESDYRRESLADLEEPSSSEPESHSQEDTFVDFQLGGHVMTHLPSFSPSFFQTTTVQPATPLQKAAELAMASTGQPSSHVGEHHSGPSVPSRKATKSSMMSLMQQPESLILPDGAIGAEAAELLEEFVHPQHHGPEATLMGSDTSTGDEFDDDLRKKAKSPWWKKPSPWWLLMLMPFTAIATSATIAPRIEMYTILACKVHRPDIFREVYPDYGIQGFGAGISQSADQLDGHAFNHPNLPSTSRAFSFFSPETSSAGIDAFSRRPIKRNKCAADHTVASAVAKLTAVISTWMGTLSILTTGWWGAFSDRYGRTRVMGIFILSLLFADFIFIMVAKISHRLPGGYWFLVIGPSLEGLLGGSATGMAASHGYLADSTNESTRTRVFSLYLGLHFTGMALGSAIGSLLIRFTGQILSVFYLATVLHLIYTILVWTVIPESLTQEQMDDAKANYAAELIDAANSRDINARFIGLLPQIKRLFAFLSPLAVFRPTEPKPCGNPLRKPKKDYNLALVAIAYGATISLMGSNSYKYQYAESTFGWKTTTVGYWVSLTGVTRAVFLTVILPLLIKLINPEPAVLRLPAEPSETTALLEGTSNGRRMRSTSSNRTLRKKEIHSPTFDLGLARASLAIEIIGFIVMGLAPVGWMFMLFGVVGSFGTGFSPAVQSVTLSLYARRGGTEIGRLYGGLSVIQALCSQIIGPSVYAFVFVKTFRLFPPAIFFVSAFCVTTSLVMLSLVRLPKEDNQKPSGEGPGKPIVGIRQRQESTLIED